MTTGEKLQKLRKEKGYTQEELSDMLNVSRQTIYKWESDIAFPETDKLIAIAKMYHCSVDYLLNNENEERSDPFVQNETKPNIEKASNKRSFALPIASLCSAIALFLIFGLNWFNGDVDFFGGKNNFGSSSYFTAYGNGSNNFGIDFKENYSMYEMIFSSGHTALRIVGWLCFISIILVSIFSILLLIFNKNIFAQILQGSNVAAMAFAFISIVASIFDGLFFGIGSIIGFLILAFMGIGQFTLKFMKLTMKYLNR